MLELIDITREEKLAQLERVLQSHAFQHSENLQAFLRFIVLKTLDDQEARLKEHVIATEVFHRSSDYDPSVNSLVRVQARKLRAKLQEHYATEGKKDRIIIKLPKGNYHPVFVYSPTADKSVARSLTAKAAGAQKSTTRFTDKKPSQPITAGAPRVRNLIFVMGGAIALLLLTVLALVFSNLELRREARREVLPTATREEYGPVWEAFLEDRNPPLLVLSNPGVYRFVNHSDPKALTDQSIKLTPEQIRAMPDAPEFRGRFIFQKGDTPRLIPTLGMYTGMGEAVGLSHLTNLFRSANKGILLKQSRYVSAEDVKYSNVILLGSVFVNEWSGKLPAGESFLLTEKATIENRESEPGEQQEYKPQFDERSGKLLVDYALVTVKPNISGANSVMTLAGIYSEGTEAAAEFVTNKEYLAELSEQLRRAQGGEKPIRYFQALLKVGVQDGTPIAISLLALHPLQVSVK